MSVEDKLKKLNIELPVAAKPSFEYVPVVIYNKIAYISGQLPKVDGEVRINGKVGESVTIEEAQEAAEICILQGLSCLKQEIGSLENVEQIIKINGYISSAQGFNHQPKVLDAASKLLFDIFGEKGRHSRAAVGVYELPRNTPVEIELTVAVK